MNSTRRDALRKIGLAGSLIAIPGIAGVLVGRAEAGVCTPPPGDDAELIRLGEEFDGLYAEWVPLAIKERELSLETNAGMKARGVRYTSENIDDCQAETGLGVVADACDAILERLDPLAERIITMRVDTVAGLAVMGRVLRFIMIYPTVNETDWQPQCFTRFQRALEALAEAQARGL